MLGERGDAVTKVQQLLNKHGYLVSGNVTGYYGEATENAVRNFQSRNGLTSDGLVGVQTMAKLTSDNVRRPAANSGGSGTPQGRAAQETAAIQEITAGQAIRASRQAIPHRL